MSLAHPIEKKSEDFKLYMKTTLVVLSAGREKEKVLQKQLSPCLFRDT